MLGGTGITVAGAVQTTKITGDIGTFPTPTITGLGNIVLNGVNQGANAVTQQAKMDLVTAYNSAAGRAPTLILTPGLDLGGLTLVPGVYKDSMSARDHRSPDAERVRQSRTPSSFSRSDRPS